MSRMASGATLTAALLLGFCLVATVIGLIS